MGKKKMSFLSWLKQRWEETYVVFLLMLTIVLGLKSAVLITESIETLNIGTAFAGVVLASLTYFSGKLYLEEYKKKEREHQEFMKSLYGEKP